MKAWDSAAGRTLMIGLPGTELDPRTARRIRDLGPGGVILFGRNLESAGQTSDLIEAVRGLSSDPLLIAIDQEGGRVSRLAPWVGPTPSASVLADAGEAKAAEFGRATALALACLGFNMDFAPVVDLCSPQARNGIGDRSFGTDPTKVVRLAGAFLEALQRCGVAGCLKHFPGLGPTDVDSHAELPTAGRSARQLEDDLLPFRRLGPVAASVMIGHGHYPSLDSVPGRPASLSPEIVSGLLRSELGYAGLVVSDDLEMGAVAPLDGNGEAAVRAMAAGCDLLLYCAELSRAETARAALVAAARRDAAMGRRLGEAALAVETAARLWPAAAGRPSAWDAARRRLVDASSLA